MSPRDLVLLTCLGCTVDVLNRKHGAQSIQQDFGQGRDQLSGSNQHVDTVGPEDEEDRGSEHQCAARPGLLTPQHEPGVGRSSGGIWSSG